MEKIKLFCLIVLLFTVVACVQSPKSEKQIINNKQSEKAYLNLLAVESQKTDPVDSLFFGIYFKMTAKAFYEHCNTMHKKGIFHGGYDYQVVIDLNEGFAKPVQLRFYPSFDKPFISSVPCRFTYANANIYNKHDRADVLIKEVIPMLMNWHRGNQFIKMPAKHPWMSPQYVKVDANRKITVFESDNSMDVEVLYEDLKPLHEISYAK